MSFEGGLETRSLSILARGNLCFFLFNICALTTSLHAYLPLENGTLLRGFTAPRARGNARVKTPQLPASASLCSSPHTQYTFVVKYICW